MAEWPDYSQPQSVAASKFIQQVPYRSYSIRFDSQGPVALEADWTVHSDDYIFVIKGVYCVINTFDYCAVRLLKNDITIAAQRSRVGVYFRFDVSRLLVLGDGDVLTTRYTNPSPNLYSFTSIINTWRVPK